MALNNPFQDLATLIATLIGLWHLAALAWAARARPALTVAVWTLRLDAVAMVLLGAANSIERIPYGDALEEPSTIIALAGLVLAGVTLARPPAWLTWSLFTIAVFLGLAIALFALTFRMTRLW